MSDEKRNRRRKYYIDKDFQLKFILKFCSLIAVTSALTVFLIYLLNRQTTTVAFENLKVVVKSTSSFILPIMIQILVTVTLLVGIGTMAIALFTSHRIVGPLYRIKTDLAKIKKGDFSFAIRIRAKDELHDVAAEFNEMRLMLKESIEALKNNWAAVRITLIKLQSGIKDEDEKERLKEKVKDIDSMLAKFKTE